MSSSQTLTERIEASYRELRKMRRRFRSVTWITAIIGFGLLLLVAGYFCYGYLEISSFRNPDLLVSLVGNTIDQQIPLLRRRIETEVENNAATWAEQASQQVIAAIPTLRQQLEDYACDQTDALIDKLHVMGEKEFRRMLKENRSAVEQALKDLEDHDELSDGAVTLLEEAMEKELEVSMQDQAAMLLTIISDVNKNFKTLHENEDLNEEQQNTRRALMIAKRLQKEHFGDVRIEDITPTIVTDAVGELERSHLEKKAESAGPKAEEPAKGKDAGQSEVKQSSPPADQKADEPQADSQDTPKDEKASQPEEKQSSPPEDQKADEPEKPDE